MNKFPPVPGVTCRVDEIDYKVSAVSHTLFHIRLIILYTTMGPLVKGQEMGARQLLSLDDPESSLKW